MSAQLPTTCVNAGKSGPPELQTPHPDYSSTSWVYLGYVCKS